jgi:pimeloyl-ACP methyl ester carboxylesterase
MAADAIAFIKTLGLKQVDLFGFSIGGMVVQQITLQAALSDKIGPDAPLRVMTPRKPK